MRAGSSARAAKDSCSQRAPDWGRRVERAQHIAWLDVWHFGVAEVPAASASFYMFFSSSGQFSFPLKDLLEILPVSQCLHNVKQLFHDPCPHKSP